MENKLTVKEVKKEFGLESVCEEANIGRVITVSDLHRPGIEISGFFNYYPAERIQILGKTELIFIDGLSHETKKERMNQLCHEYFAYSSRRSVRLLTGY